MRKGEMFGDEYLLNDNKNKMADDNIVMETDGIIAELSNQTIFNCIGGPNIEIVITKNEFSHERNMNKYSSTMKKKMENVQLSDFVFYYKLGSGQFGSVYLVKTNKIDNFFALKCISKQQIIEESLETHLFVTKFLSK